jgi:hypothetical protein
MKSIGACVVVLLLGCASGRVRPAEVVVRNLEKPGAVVVENHGAAIRLRHRLVVEQQVDGTWRDSGAYVDLVERCDARGLTETCNKVPAGATLTLVPWNGVACDGQCARPCRSNGYLGPGTFRFVVESCDRKKRFAGAGFQLSELGK